MKRNTRSRNRPLKRPAVAPEVDLQGVVGDAPGGTGPELDVTSGGGDDTNNAPAHQWIIAPLTGQVLQQWAMSFQHHGTRAPQPPRSGLAVCLPSGLFLAGVGIYDTTGPWVLCEHLSTNPMAPARVKHRAVLALGYACLAHCNALGKKPLVLVRSTGIARTLMRLGMKIQPGGIMLGELGLRI